nr:hypothetical protein [Polaribacter butkevichii]
MLKNAPRAVIYSKLNTWGNARELPKIKDQNFDEWYKVKRKK